jgi:hypothetical protein
MSPCQWHRTLDDAPTVCSIFSEECVIFVNMVSTDMPLGVHTDVVFHGVLFAGTRALHRASTLKHISCQL